MAVYIKGGPIIRSLLSSPLNPNFIGSGGTIISQVRYAARKGYREKARKKLKEQKLLALQSAPKESDKSRYKYSTVVKTVQLQKPDVPNDDIFLVNDFKHKFYSLTEAIKFHQQYHHPTVFNNPQASINLRIQINMIGKKKKTIKPFRNLVAVPNPFNLGLKREVLVFCEPEYVDEAARSGATLAGGVDLVQKVKSGYIVPALYEFVLCHAKFLPELTPIRKILKTQMPKAKGGTLIMDLAKAIPKFLHGIEYKCVQADPTHDFGLIDCQIGSIDMEPERVEENLKALLEDIENYRPDKKKEFVTWIWCKSPPSKEEFALDLSLYVKNDLETGGDAVDDDDDDDDEEEAVELTEKQEMKKILDDFDAEEEDKIEN